MVNGGGKKLNMRAPPARAMGGHKKSPIGSVYWRP